jgi:hypothetical protein
MSSSDHEAWIAVRGTHQSPPPPHTHTQIFGKVSELKRMKLSVFCFLPLEKCPPLHSYNKISFWGYMNIKIKQQKAEEGCEPQISDRMLPYF